MPSVSNNNQNIYDEELIALPLTTKAVIPGEIQPFEIPVESNKENGLDENSRILTNRINTFNNELRLVKWLDKVRLEIWERVLVSLWEGIYLNLSKNTPTSVSGEMNCEL